MKTLFPALLATLMLSCATASTPNDDIDAFVANVVKTIPEVPGVAVAVVHDGRRHTTASGYADRERQVEATPKTGFYIGSTTKAFTGVVAATLAEQGKLDLDAPVTRYLTGLRLEAPIDAERVTLRRLLSHTALIQNHPLVFRTAFSGEHTPATLLQMLDASKPRTEAFRYDNLGYVVAGLAFERVTGRTWQQLHDELVFTPLGMRDTTAFMSEAERGALAQPYEMTSRGRVELLSYRKNDRMMHAAGGTVTTADDLARWLEANVSGGRVGGRQVLSASAIAETQKTQATLEKPRPGVFAGRAYGFGWYHGTHGTQPVLFHGGGFEGWRSLFSLIPEQGIAVGVLTNSGVSNPVNQLISEYALDRLLGRENLESEYAAKLQTLRERFDKQNADTLAEGEQRAKREWQLRHERSAYAGRYEHPQYGTMRIEEANGKLFASIGTMRAELEPFTQPESARVELIPASGEVLHFVFSTGPRPDALKYRDEVFARAE